MLLCPSVTHLCDAGRSENSVIQLIKEKQTRFRVMVADAVCDEPVSCPFSLVTGKKQGIFGNFRPVAAKRIRFQASYQWLGSKFPNSDNREFESA